MLKETILLAKKAGEQILKSSFSEVSSKTGSDIVTDIDLKAEDVILKTLQRKFPDHGIYSEERGRLGKKSEYVWVIDPLDGTVNYAAGIPLYSVSIGLLKRGSPILGVVYAPAVKELYWAEKGKGAFLNGKRLRVSETSRLNQAVVNIGLAPHFNLRLMGKASGLVKRVVPKVRGLRILESGALTTCYIARGIVDAHVGVKTDPFGHTASTLFILEAGGKVTDFAGRPWNIKTGTLVCSNGKLHERVLNLLRG